MSTTLEIQRRLITLGYSVGRAGADGISGRDTKAAIAKFQADHKLPSSGTADLKTLAVLFPSTSNSGVVSIDWMPRATIKGIVVHWTAGMHQASSLDRSHYHILIEGDGKIVRGTPTIDLNSLPKIKPGYAAHTLNCNTGFIGVSLCCMAGAVEQPFEPGIASMTEVQWSVLPVVLRELCVRYKIPVSPKTVLSHAEVQVTLGITQRGKWDISRLAFDPSVKGARAIGDRFRAAIDI